MAFFEGDLRFDAVPDRERDALYDEYMFEKERSERENAQKQRKDNMRKFREKLEQDPAIGIVSQWRKVHTHALSVVSEFLQVKEQFKDDPVFTALEKFDRLAGLKLLKHWLLNKAFSIRGLYPRFGKGRRRQEANRCCPKEKVVKKKQRSFQGMICDS
jgi:hypothetical protein